MFSRQIDEPAGQLLSAEGFSFLLRSLPVAVWVVDEDLRVIAFEGSLAEAMGLGIKPLFEIFETEDPSVSPVADILSAFSGYPSDFEFVWKGRYWMSSVLVVPRDRNGPAHCLVYALDITPQRILSERVLAAEQRYRDLFDQAQDMIATCDLEGRLLTVNAAAARFTGYTRDELLTLTLYQLTKADEQPELLNLMREMLGGTIAVNACVTFRRKDRTEVEVDLHARLLFDAGVPSGIQAMVRPRGTISE